MAQSCPDDSLEYCDTDTESNIETNLDGSETSDVTVDKYGFFTGSQSQFSEAKNGQSMKLLRRRELKWLDMVENWDYFMTKKYKKVKERCRKGIPSALRLRAWLYLSGANSLMQSYKNTFLELDSQSGDPKFVDDIKKDLHRQFPLHEIFSEQNGHGQADLYRILKAYSVFNPSVGYCQAQAPLAATLLMHMPAEQAFWCLVSLCERYVPGYYSPGLEAIQIDGDILFGLLKKVAPSVYKHFKKQKVDPVFYMTEWFMCLYSRTLSWAIVLRVWDVFLCEGVKILFRVGLLILKHTFSEPGAFKKYPTLYEISEHLRQAPKEFSNPDWFIHQVFSINVSEDDLQKEHQRQLLKRHKLKEQKQMSENGLH